MPTIPELLTLAPEDDIPGDARLTVTAEELRAICAYLTVLEQRQQADHVVAASLKALADRMVAP